MKKIILITSIVWFSRLLAFSQNLVPNPSFEQVSDCDLYFDDFDKVKTWKGYNFTPDVFHSCSQSAFLSTPKNTFDNQTPAQGQAYAGILTYHRDFQNELIGIKLLKTIEQGKTYQVSFKISRAMAHARYATNNIGVLFTNHPENSYHCQRAHINERQVIEESDVWHTIAGTFEADSTYEYLVIGNFFGSTNTILKTMPEGSFEAAYYFVDDVFVAEVPPGTKISTQNKPTNSLISQNYRPKAQNPTSPNTPIQKVKIPESPALRRITLRGRVLDAETRQPLASIVEYQVPYTKDKSVYETDYESGNYSFENLPVPPQFEMKIQARNYYTIIQSINISQENTLEKDFYLQPLRAGQSIPLTSIGFKPGPEELTPDSFAELNRLIQILKDNPLMKIEVGGHTDHPDRMETSKLQAQSVKQYLVNIGGINPSRISIHIYLESTPSLRVPDAADEKTEIERVEFKILN